MELSNKQPDVGVGSLAALYSLTMTNRNKLRNFTSCRMCFRGLHPPCIGNGRISHIACAACAGKLPGGECPGCDNRGVFEYTDYIEKYLVGLEIKCKHAGCNISVSCLDFLDHERLCPQGLNISSSRPCL